MTQIELTDPGLLLNPNGSLVQVGWARQPILECNLEYSRFYMLRFLQHFRIKRWDYYAVFSPRRFFSATIADLGYAGNIFIYTIDLETGDLHEEGLVIPFSKGIILPRKSDQGDAHFQNEIVRLDFYLVDGTRRIYVNWPDFHQGRGLEADISFDCPPEYESMNIVIPIGERRFYYNRKINCMPASGQVKYGDLIDKLDPATCSGSLDWGRGVWEYRSYWNWASSSGFLPDGRTIGLNMGCGFGDLSKSSENALVLDNCIHKLGKVTFDYASGDYMKPWKFTDDEKRLDLIFTPFLDRTAKTNLGIITSEVHQMFGHYNGRVIADNSEVINVNEMVGFAEEHHAKW
jgi:hypothetical protein